MNIGLIFVLGFCSIPFYILESGSVQPSHVILLIFSFAIILSKHIGFRVNVNRSYLLFFINVLIINLAYSLVYEKTEFLIYSLALFLNLIIFTSVCSITNNIGIYIFLKKNFSKAIFLIFLILLILWWLGLGEYRFGGRYNGFFNDPNQMAFFVLCSISLGCAYTYNLKLSILIVLLGVVLITLTFSRSALTGLFFSFLCFLGWGGYRLFKKNILILLMIIFFLCISFLLFYKYKFSLEYFNVYIDRFFNTDFSDQADIRGYTRILEYPEYLLFGAGQGFEQRFGTDNEIHSTWLGILFYYGVLGFYFFMKPIFDIFFRLDMKRKILFIAPMLYGFSTFSARTTVFWIFIGLFYILSIHKERS